MEQFTAYVFEGKAQWINFSQHGSKIFVKTLLTKKEDSITVMTLDFASQIREFVMKICRK